jgi:hypothetical protein
VLVVNLTAFDALQDRLPQWAIQGGRLLPHKIALVRESPDEVGLQISYPGIERRVSEGNKLRGAMSPIGTSRTFCDVRLMSAIEGKPDIRRTTPQVCD